MEDIKTKINPYLLMIYKYILPLLGLVWMLILASMNKHIPIAQNPSLDFILRLIFSGYFCMVYIGLTKENKIDAERMALSNDIPENFFINFLRFLYAFLNGAVTYWILEKFFLYNFSQNLFISILNGFVILFPLITRIPSPQKQIMNS